MAKNLWLIKSEPDVFSFDDLKACPKQTEHWDGIRNYQARNFMRDSMKKGDIALFYHSNAGPQSGAVGLAEVVSESAYPDHTQFDPKSDYYDAKSKPEEPRWLMVDFKYALPFKRLVSLKEMKETPELEEMLVVKRGQRLSIQPVELQHFKAVCKMGGLLVKDLKTLGV
ncbi:EVE domain-containing protein [Pelagicoccus sp. SDUM812003]|uniref:EVE domain-containing protein n=1 Tax=Pelagicoccus sp. SDUM812003 TaxID=3041267 RepID=UPI00280CFCBD|nr:EVE domain-containing protein [Pelagicoccus sp. SDUM812003]MDQ8203073.1 EVE domain-containing protein [Pelagicoccus sp. SDUM812003]